jgi:hypothetical protein
MRLDKCLSHPQSYWKNYGAGGNQLNQKREKSTRIRAQELPQNLGTMAHAHKPSYSGNRWEESRSRPALGKKFTRLPPQP